MLESLSTLDTELLLFLNQFHSPFFDSVMFRLTNQLTWLPFFLFIIFFIYKNFKKDTLWILLGVAIVITLSDQFVSGFMKPYFGRFRPSNDPSLVGLLHIVNGYKGGLYGFASSHAANSFGIATFLWLTTHKNIKWIWIMFVWALIFSYTRIYLGVHYPGDVIVGAIVGMLLSYLVFWMYKFALSKIRKSKTYTL